MEDLEALDAMDLTIPQSSAASSGAAAPAAAPASATPSKRRKAGLLGSSFLGKAASRQAVKQEEQDEKVKSKAAAAESPECAGLVKVEETGEDPDEDKHCIGCGRSRLNGKCFIKNTPLVWALPDGRGAWCRDCFSTWRTLYSPVVTLVLFAVWLQKPENARQFEFNFVALLSLKYEGIERITEPALLARKAMLEWVFKMLAIPLGPFQIMRLRDVPSGQNMESARLVNLVLGAVDSPVRELGYMVSSTEKATEPQVVESFFNLRRPPDTSFLGLESRRKLATSNQEDIHAWRRCFPDEPVPGTSDQVVASNQPSGGMSQQQKRILSQIAHARGILEGFGVTGWQSLKESSFTATCNKLVSLKVDMASLVSDAVLKDLEKWVVAMSGAKFFIKKYKEHVKSPTKEAKLKALHPSISNLVDFLYENNMQVDVTLNLLRLRVDFLCHTSSSFRECFEHIAGLRLDDVLTTVQAEGDGDVPANVWMRGLIFDKLATRLTEADVQKCDEFVQNVFADITWLRQALMALRSATKLEQLVTEIDHLLVMLRAQMDPTTVKASDAKRAKQAMAGAEFAQLAGPLKESAVGKELMAAVSDLILRTSSDDTADGRFALARQALEDSRMFGVEVVAKDGAQKILIRCASMVVEAEPTIFNLSLDALHQVMDAKSLWSALRQEETGDDLVAWCTRLGQTLVAAEVIQCELLSRQLADVVSALGEDSDEYDPHTYDPLCDWTAIAHESEKSLLLDMIDQFTQESVWGKAQDKFLLCFGNAVGTIANHPELKTLVADVAKSIRHNRDVRSTIAELWRALVRTSQMRGPLDPEAMLLEFRAAHESSFLHACLSAARAAERLEQDQQFLIGCGGLEASQFSFKLDDTEPCCVRSAESLQALPGGLLALPLLDWIRDRLTDLASKSAAAFVAGCELRGIKKSSGSLSCSGQPIQTILQAMVTPSAMTKTKANAVQVFRHTLGEPELDSTKAFALMKDVVDIAGVADLALCSNFCLEGAPVVVPTDKAIVMFTLTKLAHEASSVLLLVWTEVRQPQDFIAEHKLRADLAKALLFAESACQEAEGLIESEMDAIKAIESLQVPWRLPVSALTAWFADCLRVIKELRRRAFAAHVADTHALAQQVDRHTPKYDHFLNDNTFQKSLVRKHLLNNSNIKQLNVEIVALFRALEHMGELSAQFGYENPRKDIDHKEVLEYIDLVWAAGKRTLVVVAAVTVALATTGPGQATQAQAFLSKDRSGMPAALLEEIRKIANPAVGGVKRSAEAAALKDEPAA